MTWYLSVSGGGSCGGGGWLECVTVTTLIFVYKHDLIFFLTWQIDFVTEHYSNSPFGEVLVYRYTSR